MRKRSSSMWAGSCGLGRRRRRGRRAASALTVWLAGGLLLGCGEGGRGRPDAGDSTLLPEPEPGALESAASATELDSLPPEEELALADSALPDPEVDQVGRPVFERPEHIRGIYLNAWTAGASGKRRGLLNLARRTEINSFVIDIKDATGYVSQASKVPLAIEAGATQEIRIRDLPGLLRLLAAEGIYPIARIVVAKDPLLPLARPELAVQDSAGGPWRDKKGNTWLNFHLPEVWQYHLELAREVVQAGFPEIQWDYVRFPDAPEDLMARAVFPGSEGRTRSQAVRDFLAYTKEGLAGEGVQVTADVFGITTAFRRDVGIGQVWESFIDQVDVALPMVYPSHYYAGSYGYDVPNAYPYEVVRAALNDALGRSANVDGAGLTRPWLQDFSLGEPPYGAAEVRAQIQATYDTGITEWILWHPGSRYTEAALLPARGLPSWLEPVIRVADQVVPVSERFQALGEEPPADMQAADEPFQHDTLVPSMEPILTPTKLPPVVIPDTSGGKTS